MDANYLKLMDGGDVLLLSKRIVGQALDRGKIGRKLGGNDDLVQSVAEILVSVLAGEVVFDSNRVVKVRVGKVVDPSSKVSFAGFVMSKVRWIARENWMLEAPLDVQETAHPKMTDDAPTDDDEEADEKAEVARLQTVTPNKGGADTQSEDVARLDDPDGAPRHAYTGGRRLGLLDDRGDEEEDDRLTVTPAHNLLKQADPTMLAGLLGCTNRTIINLRARANDSRRLSM